MASTPPPPSPSTLRVPQAPRHGPKYDNYEPYPTRYSARLASQRASRAVRTTPPLGHSSASARSGTPKRTLSPSSPGNAKTSPKKAARSRQPAASGVSPFEMEPSLPRTSTHNSSRSSAERALPTPAKTPSKKKVISSDTSTSRSLFPSNSTPKRRKMEPSKRTTSIFFAEPQGRYAIGDAKQDFIPIHEDSRDRIPVARNLLNDPFSAQSTSDVRRPATRSVTCNNEGVWYMDRGQKVFKRFEDMDDEGEDEDDLGLFANRPDLLADNPDLLKNVKTLKRSEIKPCILFPKPDNVANAEEEVTDVEDNEPMSPTPAHEPHGPRLAHPKDFHASLSHPPASAPAAPLHRPGEAVRTPYPGLDFGRNPYYAMLEGLEYDSSEFTGPQTAYNGSGSTGSLLNYWPVIPKVKVRPVETRAERMKRFRETRGSPAPRTRKAQRDAAAAEASDAQVPTAEASTTDV